QVVDVLEHVYREDEIEERLPVPGCHLFRRASAIVDAQAALLGMPSGDLQRLLRRIDSRDDRSFPGQGFGEDPATAPHVEDAFLREPPEHSPKVIYPDRIELV